MPIYEYQCSGCDAVFEVRQKLSDPAPQEHSCGSKEVRRILSNTSFVLKGTGWYKTDYASKPETKTSTESQKSAAPTPSSPAKDSGGSSAPKQGKKGGGGSEAA